MLEVGYTSGNEQVAWLMVEPIQPPATVATLHFSVMTQVSPGTYTAHPSIAIVRSDGTPIALRGLTVTYQVLP